MNYSNELSVSHYKACIKYHLKIDSIIIITKNQGDYLHRNN